MSKERLYVSTDMTSYYCHIVATDEVSDFLRSWWAWCNISDIYNQRASPFMVTPETFSPPTHSVKLKYAHWATVRYFDFTRFSFIMIFIFIACSQSLMKYLLPGCCCCWVLFFIVCLLCFRVSLQVCCCIPLFPLVLSRKLREGSAPKALINTWCCHAACAMLSWANAMIRWVSLGFHWQKPQYNTYLLSLYSFHLLHSIY